MSKKIFIDGAAGTTGLLIESLLKPWEDAGAISLITIEDRKDTEQRKAAFAQADLSVLCLPDDAAREAVSLLPPGARVLDASSAHRVTPGWTYGLPELNDAQPAAIAAAERVSNPGCFATGAVTILRPLTDAGLIDADERITITGVSGYSGGGKKMIALYEGGDEAFALSNVFNAVSLNAPHKHLAEIQRYAGLEKAPIFLPSVVDACRGMIVGVTLAAEQLHGSLEDVRRVLEAAYNRPDSKITVCPSDPTASRLGFEDFIAINQAGAPPLDTLRLHISGWEANGERQVSVHAVLDNLGKGAATQAMQNIMLMLGL